MKVFIFDLDDTLFDSSGRDLADEWRIQPFEGVLEFLSNAEGRVVLVSRGDADRQKKKLKILGIDSLFDDIRICKTDGEKFDLIKSIAAHPDDELIVIGNRIDHEIRYGNMLGLKTIYLRHGKYAVLEPQDDFEIPDVVIDTFEQIRDVLP